MHRGGPNPRCPVGHEMECVLAEVYAEIRRGMDDLLARTTLADIVAAIRGRLHHLIGCHGACGPGYRGTSTVADLASGRLSQGINRPRVRGDRRN